MRLNQRQNGARNEMADSDNPDPTGEHDRKAWSEADLGEPGPALRSSAAAYDESADDDPIASLFRTDQTLRAPSIAPAPSEAELKRWNATMRSSLFDEQVTDPAPAAGPRPAHGAAQLSGERMLDLPEPPPPLAAATAREQPVPPARLLAPVAPPMAPPPLEPTARLGTRTSGTQRSGVRSKSETDPALQLGHEREAPRAGGAQPAGGSTAGEAASSSARRRRLERGPKPLTLALLALAAVAVVGSAAAMLGLIPNPLAEQPAPHVPPQRLEAPPAPAPVQAQAAQLGAAQATEAEMAKAAEPEPAPAARAEVTPGKAASPPAAAPVAEQPATAKTAAQAQAEAPAAAEALAAAPVEAEPAADAQEQTGADEQAEAAEEQAQAGGGPSTLAERRALMATARKHLADDEPERAEAVARKLLDLDDSDHHSMELLVRALMDQDRGREAVPHARMMVQRRSRRVPYRLLLGDVLLMVGDQPAARAQWQAALKLAPDDKDVKLRLGL